MPAKDGLIILERSLANNSQNNREKQLLFTQRQQTSSQMPLGKSWRVFSSHKGAIFWGENATFISKTKRAPGFEAGRDKLTLLLCANAVRFMIRTGLIYKANP